MELVRAVAARHRSLSRADVASPMPRPCRRITVTSPLLALLAVAAAAFAPSAAAGPVAHGRPRAAARQHARYGTTYVLKISVSGTSCRAGKALIRAFHACRPGKSGKCPRVKGYRCSERRFNGIRTSVRLDA